jgi:hypothetical protein
VLSRKPQKAEDTNAERREGAKRGALRTAERTAPRSSPKELSHPTHSLEVRYSSDNAFALP